MSTLWLPDNRRVVGCDLDDVLADFSKGFMLIAHDKYGVNPNLRPTSWEWDDCDMPADRVDGTWNELIHNRPNWWETLDVEDGVDTVLLHKVFNKTKLFFPTARANNVGRPVEIQSQKWLFNKFDLLHPTVIVSGEKGPLALALKYDYFLDDRPKNCIDIKKACPDAKVFMKTATHNPTVDLSHLGIHRVANFNEFAKVVLAEA
jgi:5'(3')-deoxyribonucleotidase